MRLREANSVTAMVTPLAMHFPVETLTIKVSPLKLQIKGNKLMRGAMRLLEDRSAAWGIHMHNPMALVIMSALLQDVMVWCIYTLLTFLVTFGFLQMLWDLVTLTWACAHSTSGALA